MSIRKFGKDHYQLFGGYGNKFGAERDAKHLKEEGYRYKIIKKTHTMTTYNTPPYKRKETIYHLYYCLSGRRKRRS